MTGDKHNARRSNRPSFWAKKMRGAQRFVPTKRMRGEEQQFLPPARSIIETPPSPVSITLAILICLIVGIAISAAIIGRIDIYAEAPGRIQPIGRSKVVQAASSGQITQVLVHDGSAVKKYQVLIELDPTETGATREGVVQKKHAYGAEIARQTLEISAALLGNFSHPGTPDYPEGTPPDIRARETAVLRADLANLDATLTLDRAKLSENIAQASAIRESIIAQESAIINLEKRVDIRDQLQRKGWEALSNVLDAREDLDKSRADLVTSKGQLNQTLAAYLTLKGQLHADLTKFVSDDEQNLRDTKNNLDQATQELVKTSSELDDMTITAPIDGTVQQLGATTLGQVVAAGQQLLTVVPNNAPLELEADMQNKDIGFVHVGDLAVVKVDAFPFTRYGTISGRVVRVSRDAVDAQEASSSNDDTKITQTSPQASTASQVPHVASLVYPVTIRLDRNTIPVNGHSQPLAPGMTVVVEVRTGKRRVISYVLSPFLEATSNAGHER